MNYEQKYESIMSDIDAAILGARDEKTKITLENIKSRNTESKDERIRKALICGLSEGLSDHNWQDFGGATIDECIAWLERQKEEEGYEANPVESTLEYKLGFRAGKESEKQKERQDNPDAHESSWQGEISSSRKDTKFDDYLKATPAERRKMNMTEILDEQKPAEWSEEDETFVKDAIEAVENYYSKGCGQEELVTWLKSLRPQPKQEKDSYKDGFVTARRTVARVFMQYLDENRPEGKMCLSNGECEDIERAFIAGDWDKIIRYANKYQPHWKPSEEQMEWLETAVKLAKKSDRIYPILESLYNDLQKLM